MKPIEILERLKQEDYELYIQIGRSHLSEEQWDWLIETYPYEEKYLRRINKILKKVREKENGKVFYD